MTEKQLILFLSTSDPWVIKGNVDDSGYAK